VYLAAIRRAPAFTGETQYYKASWYKYLADADKKNTFDVYGLYKLCRNHFLRFKGAFVV